MIKFQTRFTKLLIGENISLAKKGKNPLRVIFELREDFKEFGYWETGNFFLKVGKYHIFVETPYNKRIFELIDDEIKHPDKYQTLTTITVKSIKIKEWD